MKYLKVFEAFEDIETLKKDIGDILQELVDKGFIWSVLEQGFDRGPLRNPPPINDILSSGNFLIKIAIGNKFNWSEISDEVYHLIEYMKSKGYEVDCIITDIGRVDFYGNKCQFKLGSFKECENDLDSTITIISASISFKSTRPFENNKLF